VQETFELDLKEIFGVLIKRIWMIAIAAVLGFSIAYVISKFVIPPKYTSSVSLYVNNTSESQAAAAAVNINDINASQKLVNTYIVILQDDELLDQVGARLLEEYNPEWLSYSIPVEMSEGGYKVSTAALREMLTMSAVNNTEVLQIQAESKNAELSARVCTMITELAPELLMRVVKAGSVEVIGAAKPASSPSSPRIMVNSAIGLAAGIALAVIVILLLHLLDNTIKDEEGIKKRFTIPVLGEIPDFNSQHAGGYSHYGK
jgi:capsular polysaccharide biosynthesis protein